MTTLSAEVEAALEMPDDIVKRGLSLNAAVYSTLAAEVRRLHAWVRELSEENRLLREHHKWPPDAGELRVFNMTLSEIYKLRRAALKP